MESGTTNQPTDNPSAPAIEPRWLKTPAAGVRVGRSTSWLKKARRGLTEFSGPPFRLMGRNVFYRLDELDAWMDQFGPSMTVLPGVASSDSGASK